MESQLLSIIIQGIFYEHLRISLICFQLFFTGLPNYNYAYFPSILLWLLFNCSLVIISPFISIKVLIYQMHTNLWVTCVRYRLIQYCNYNLISHCWLHDYIWWVPHQTETIKGNKRRVTAAVGELSNIDIYL